MPVPMEITPQEVRLRLEAGEKLHLTEVREPHEYAQARTEGSELVQCVRATGTRMLSRDGKTLTFTGTGVTVNGRQNNSVMVYDKQ